MDPEMTHLLSRQPSGIRALPSYSDDDDVDINDDFDENPLYETNSSVITDLNDMNLSYNSSYSNISSFSSDNNGSYVSGAAVDVEVFETPIHETELDPDGEMLGNLVGRAQNEGSVLSGFSAREVGVPVAKVSGEGDDDDDDDDDDDEGVGKVEERGYGVENGTPKVRVSDEGEEEWSESLEEHEGEGLECVLEGGVEVGSGGENGALGDGVEGSGSLRSSNVDYRGVELVDERDGGCVVDSVHGDVGEAVRLGIVVVGAGEEESGVGTVEDSGVGEESVEEGSRAVEGDGVTSMNEGVSVEGSASIGSVELGDAVAEVREEKDSEVELGDKLTSAVEDSSASEVDEVKYTKEGDAIVDSINVDAVEAVRSGTAVVGGMQGTATEAEGSVIEDATAVEEDFVAEEEDPKAIETDDVKSAVKLKFVSGRENEKVQPNYVDEKLHSNVVLVEGEGVTKTDPSYAGVLVDGIDVTASDENHLHKSVGQTKIPSSESIGKVVDEKHVVLQEGDVEGSGTDEEGDLVYFGSGSSSRNMIEELGSHNHSEMIDGQFITDSEEEGDSDEEGEGKGLFDSAALVDLLKTVTTSDSDSGSITITSQDGSRLFSVERPAGLGSSLRSVRRASGPTNSSFFGKSSVAAPSVENLSEEEKKKLESLQQLKVKFLRLVQRVGYTAEHSLAAQVLYKLTVYAGRKVSPAFSLDNAKQTAMKLEAEGKDDLDLSLNILFLGKTGVGKSALINSLCSEGKVKINAFEPETAVVNEVHGVVDGVKIRFIDAPGLKSSFMEQAFNRKVLASVKKFMKKYPPDVVFYVDRLDSQTRDLNDLPMLKTISSTLGSAIWRNAIIALTHASSAPLEGLSGTPLTYELFVAQRSHIVQQSIGQAVDDLRLMNLNMMNPVSLVENHPACRKNREGEKVLPNGQAWRPQLLLLCYSVKILSEASATSKPQEPIDPRKLFGFRVRSPPLPYLLSSLLQPRAHPKLSADQGGDNVDSDVDLDDVSDSDQEEEEDEYDQLPPFKPLRKAQIAKLHSDQRKAYFEEYDYRVRLLQRKQWKEELKRMREMKKNGNSGVRAYGEMLEDDGENGGPAAVPVPLPDMVLPPSFDCDNPAYRYRFLEPTSQFLARPVMDPHSWDHDCGYDGVNVEQNLGIVGRFPAALSVQVSKDKKDFNIHVDSAVAAKHGENGSSLVGFDVQTIGKQYAYIVIGESKFKNMKKNKTAAGVTVTFLGENVATGVKVEDQIMLGKRLVLVGSTGTVRSQKDAAYGANLEVRLREADYPIGQEQSSFTLSLMKWRGDLAVGANLQSQIPLWRNAKSAVRLSLNNKMSGQITVKTSSTDQLSLALAGLVPIAIALYRKIKPEVSESYSIY